jgi:GTP-binding protein Era
MEESFKSGFVAIIGRPNVGKSTLLNFLAKRKVAIISDKPQTTRHKIRAVLNREDAQIIFIDTPGFHRPRDVLGQKLNEAVLSALREVDAIVFVIDTSQVIGAGDCYIAAKISKCQTPTILALNKIDKINQTELEAQIEVSKQLGSFHQILPISAKSGENIGRLVDELVALLPLGPRYYPDNIITDQPERVIVAEFVREKVLELTREEVPHSVAVEVQEMKPRKGRDLIDVFATIFVERDSQKGIIIGKGGRMLKEIGQRARLDIEHLLGSQVYLDLHVRVKKKWRKDEHFLQQFGYH